MIRQEIQLAKAELSEKASRMGRNLGFVVTGGLIAYCGVVAVIAAIVLGLIEIGLPPWASALLVGILAGLTGYLLIRTGLPGLRLQELKPQRTIATLREDAQWLRTQAK